MEPMDTPHGKVAFQFASHLMAGEFDEAHLLLTAPMRALWPVHALEEAYGKMIEYFHTEPCLVMVMNTLEDWPARQEGDLGWAYAAIESQTESEAVSVVVSGLHDELLIRSLEWGRP